MTVRDPLLARGIAAVKAGDKHTARELLTRAAQQNPDSEEAWLWLSAVLDTPQGRLFCLRQVLTLNPANRAAQRGLTALEKAQPAPAVIVQPPTPPLPPPKPHEGLARPDELARRTRFWQVVVACLAVIALGLVGVLAYASLAGSGAAEEEALAAVAPRPTLGPAGTLRPTFTSTPTPTPTSTDTPTPTFTPTCTCTPTPTDTPTPTALPTSRPARQSRPTATLTPQPRPTLPLRLWDGRLNGLGVRLEPAPVTPGQPFWRLVEARWTNEEESGGKHSIYVEVIDEFGRRTISQPVVVRWAGGSQTLPVEDRPPPDWGVNFPMYNTLGSYSVSVGGSPSDRIVGMGLGTAEAPAFTVHTCFYLVFRWVHW